jgi:hypothetical protein
MEGASVHVRVGRYNRKIRYGSTVQIVEDGSEGIFVEVFKERNVHPTVVDICGFSKGATESLDLLGWIVAAVELAKCEAAVD